MDQMMQFGARHRLTPEQLANAIELDPAQIAGMGPSLDHLIRLLEERKRKILTTYEAGKVSDTARRAYAAAASGARIPKRLKSVFDRAVRQGQVRDLERLWYGVERSDPAFAADLLHVKERLGERYQIEALASAYTFTGSGSLSF